ncbi:MAG TPA: hypothetical protein VJI32_04360 [Candidatus Nanoarchaeia archaeon]|nr:hypothetical protein [Candidatus Woesearchaeota archaeon]HIG93830.1 hypothetical protein [Candidatus Woesearchaeota archaeon]HIH13413.1 hypothetical protein [Candidatus Woesearchaeota archaeon]HLC71216.1 hypothetical protein [Candidatus Nanoarchaeia archaeon]
MEFYLEGLLWYLLAIDCLIYNIMNWRKGETHWISDYFPLSRVFGFLYALLTLWLGFALYRMQLIVFW